MTAKGNPWDDFGSKPSERLPRSLETRERTQRERSWTEPSILPDVAPRDGLVFKWVRTGTRNTPDKTNMQKRLREGWTPVMARSYPELVVDLGFDPDDNASGHIEIGGLILCSMPEEMVAQRRAHYDSRTNEVLTSADENYMRDSNELMKKFVERRSRAVFGR